MRPVIRLVSITIVASALTATSSYAGSVSAAKSRIMQAQDFADGDRKDDALDKLKEAETFLDGLSDDEKAPIVKQIATLRAKLTARSGAPAPAAGVDTPAPAVAAAVDPGVAGGIQRNVERYLSFAEDDAATSPSDATQKLEQAISAFNADDAKAALSADVRAKLQSRIDTLQSKLKAINGDAAARGFIDRIERGLSAASNGPHDREFARARLDEVRKLLASDEATTKLDPAALQRMQAELAGEEAKFTAGVKKDALDQAGPLFKSLDDKLTSNPFKEVQPIDAYKVTSELRSLTLRIQAQLNALPDGDADRKSLEDRLAAAQKKIDGYDADFAAGNAELAVVNQWSYASQGFAGWDQESEAATGRAFAMPKLDKTGAAAKEAKHFLEDKATVDAKANAADMPKAAAAIGEAEKTLADAQAKLDSSFNKWMDDAERQPRPQGANRFDIDAAATMSRWAAGQLGGSKYAEADVARANKLDHRWKDELAAIAQQHAAARQKMTDDANAAWPAIVASIDAHDDFHAGDAAAMQGKTFRFNRVRNRSGWDFDGRYDLVIWVDGQPVAGTYDPKIKQAFTDAARQIGDSVDDHIDWDVIATIDGTGSVNQRFTTEVKDDHQEVLGKLEGTRPVGCVTLRIVAIHAGPIAVSTK